MALLKTPEAQLGKPAPDFRLLGVDDKYYTLADCAKKNGLVVAFICNHCPYVKSSIEQMVKAAHTLQQEDIGFVAICANNPKDYPEDSFVNMKKFSKDHQFTFPYCVDETQAVAKAYDAVCTPDIFGYNSNFSLQYRGRIDDLVDGMRLIAKTGKGPKNQKYSQGCSIKWYRT